MTWLRHSLPHVRVSPAQTGPTRAHQSPFETWPMLIVDRSMLTIDQTHMSVAQTLWTHMSDGDVMMTSRETHTSEANTAGVTSC